MIDSQFIAQMEDLIELYERPYDSRFPVVCLDERPCQLLGNIVTPLSTRPGSVHKEDYEYKHNGTYCTFISIEPLHGKRIIRVRRHPTKIDIAHFMKLLASRYADAEKFIVVQENLNTHKIGSFYAAFTADEARRLIERFEVHYTSIEASWLNMAEIELSILSKQC